jgi:hypothetical protein
MAWDFISGHFCARRFHFTLSRHQVKRGVGALTKMRVVSKNQIRKKDTNGNSVGSNTYVVSAPAIPNREQIGKHLDYRVGRPRADHRSSLGISRI